MIWVLKIGLMSSSLVIFYRISFLFILVSMPPKEHTYWKPLPSIRPLVEGGTLFLGFLRWRAKVHFLLRWEYLCSDGMRTSSLIDFGWISNRVPKNQTVRSATCFGGGCWSNLFSWGYYRVCDHRRVQNSHFGGPDVQLTAWDAHAGPCDITFIEVYKNK